MTETSSFEAFQDFFSPNANSVYVTFQVGEELRNILGVFSTAAAAYECILEYANSDKLVVSPSDIEALTPDQISLICTKELTPEIRVARSFVDPESRELSA